MSWRDSREYRVWRVAVIRRDGVCQVCGARKKRQAHHMNSGKYFPEDRYDVDNGVVLCADCHRQFHTNFKRSFQTKCTKYDYANFTELVKYILQLDKKDVK